MFCFEGGVATIRPGVLLGSAQHESDYAMIKGRGVTHILQVGGELVRSYPDKFNYMSVGIDDQESEDMLKRLPSCLAFIDEAVAAGGVVLVHCMAGISRSASVCVGYLMWKEKLPFEAAFKHVKHARPCIYPNLGFLFQLWDFEQMGCTTEGWPGWSRTRFNERLEQYRKAQKEAGLHPAVRDDDKDDPLLGAVAPLQMQQFNVEALRLAAERALQMEELKAEGVWAFGSARARAAAADEQQGLAEGGSPSRLQSAAPAPQPRKGRWWFW